MSIANAIIRWFRGLPPPKISRSEAIELAKAECVRGGWRWIEPIRVSEHLDCYGITTNLMMSGANPTFRVDNMTGLVERGVIDY